MKNWSCRLEVATPLFLAGANQNDAELRPSSFKNLMRWWYRAAKESLDPEEGFLFGSTDQASKFRLRLFPEAVSFGQFDRRDEQDGLKYLGFSLDTGLRRRSFIAPRGRFKIEISPTPFLSNEYKKVVWASFWLFLWMGGIGTRSRRGFGSLRVLEADPLSTNDLLFKFDREFEDLRDFIQTNLHVAKDWIRPKISSATLPEYTILDGNSKIYILKKRFGSGKESLNWAGKLLMEFRIQHRDPDYREVKNYLRKSAYAPSDIRRTIFGLPIQFSYSSLQREKMVRFIEDDLRKKGDPAPHPEAMRIAQFRGEQDIVYALQAKYPKESLIEEKVRDWRSKARVMATATVKGETHERRASPLFIKVLKIKEEEFALMIFFLKASLLEKSENLEVSSKTRGPASVAPPDFALIEEFLKKEVAPNSWEIWI